MPSISLLYFSSIRIWDHRFHSIKLNRHLRDRCPGLKPRSRLKQRMLMHCAILFLFSLHQTSHHFAHRISQPRFAFWILKMCFYCHSLTFLISVQLVQCSNQLGVKFDIYGYGPRRIDDMNVYLPTLKKVIYKNSFLYKRGHVWNRLPAVVIDSPNLKTFK